MAPHCPCGSDGSEGPGVNALPQSLQRALRDRKGDLCGCRGRPQDEQVVISGHWGLRLGRELSGFRRCQSAQASPGVPCSPLILAIASLA